MPCEKREARKKRPDPAGRQSGAVVKARRQLMKIVRRDLQRHAGGNPAGMATLKKRGRNATETVSALAQTLDNDCSKSSADERNHTPDFAPSFRSEGRSSGSPSSSTAPAFPCLHSGGRTVSSGLQQRGLRRSGGGGYLARHRTSRFTHRPGGRRTPSEAGASFGDCGSAVNPHAFSFDGGRSRGATSQSGIWRRMKKPERLFRRIPKISRYRRPCAPAPAVSMPRRALSRRPCAGSRRRDPGWRAARRSARAPPSPAR